jgi:hypothetical protein
VASQHLDLFSPLDPTSPEYPTVIGGEHETPERIAWQFLEAADQLAAAWRAERERGGELPIALPILQTYRHAIELLLKAGCFEIARLQRFTLKMGYGKATEPNDLESVLGNMHGIGEIIELLNNLMDGLDVDKESSKLPDEVQETLVFLHDADERGQAFRYGTQRISRRPPVWSPVRPNETAIHLDSAITRLHDAAQMLVDGLGGYLDAYESNMRDMWSEWRHEMEGYAP